MRWFDAGVNCFDKRMPLHLTVEQSIIAGVTDMCVIATHQQDWPECLQAVAEYPDNLRCTLGVHPHYADSVTADWDKQLSSTLNTQNSDLIVAIGECGLDFNRMFSTKENQLTVFERQLQLAIEHGLPVYLHERDAFDDQFELLSKYANQLKSGLVHCFTQSIEHMQAYLSLGLYIGVTGWICDPKRGDALREAVKSLPLDRLVLETDAPYLFPKTVKPRQSNNHPKYIPEIAKTVADLTGSPIERIAEQTYVNTKRLFALPDQGKTSAR